MRHRFFVTKSCGVFVSIFSIYFESPKPQLHVEYGHRQGYRGLPNHFVKGCNHIPPPKMNMSPEKGPSLYKGKFIFQPSIFRGYVNFQGYTTLLTCAACRKSLKDFRSTLLKLTTSSEVNAKHVND